MKSIIVFCLLFVGPLSIFGQTQYPWALEANTIFDFEKKYYGLQFQLEKKILSSRSQNYTLSAGLSNEFHFVNERDLDAVSGNTLSNQLGVVVSHHIYFLKTKQLYLANTAYAAWSYRRTQARFSDLTYEIEEDIYSDRHFLGIGLYWKLGYELNEHWSIQLTAKTDLSRLVDEYEFELARPGLLYGVGLRKGF